MGAHIWSQIYQISQLHFVIITILLILLVLLEGRREREREREERRGEKRNLIFKFLWIIVTAFQMSSHLELMEE